MFLVLGGVLLGYGVVGDAAEYQRSLGVNINVGWGSALMAFGAGLLLWRRVRPAALPPGRP